MSSGSSSCNGRTRSPERRRIDTPRALEALQRGVEETLEDAKVPGFDLAVRLAWVPPALPRVGIGTRPAVDEDLARGIEVDVLRHLGRIGHEPEGPIHVEVQFMVRGGSGVPFGTT